MARSPRPAAAMLLAASLAVTSSPSSAAESGATASCAADSLYRQLDFTIGSWDVYADDKKIARVTMEPVLSDCAIRETWTNGEGRPGGGNGLGLFTYSRLQSRWHYLWVTDNAAVTSFLGSQKAEGQVVFVTERPLPNGGVRLRHWTLSREPGGKVRELSVGTEDQGKTWSTEYDLIWKRADK